MNRRGTIAALAVTAVAAAGVVPAFATAERAKAKPLKGTWSFTDVTPDPSATAEGNVPGGKDPYCHGGHVPSAPVDKNAYTLKLTRAGTLTVVGSNTLDWAMELDDAKGNTVASSDGGLPQDNEGLVAALPKAGSYTLLYCNLTGAPTATASYSFKPR